MGYKKLRSFKQSPLVGLALLFLVTTAIPFMQPVMVYAAGGSASVQFAVNVVSAKPSPVKSVVLIVPGKSGTNDIDMGDCTTDNRLLLVEAGKPLTCHNMSFKNFNPSFPSAEVVESPGYPCSYTITSNNTNGTIKQEKFGRPVMNFDSGNAVITINVTPGETNTYVPPSLSATSITNSSVSLSWTPGVFPKDSPYWYTVYSTSKKIAGVIKDTSTTARFDGLTSCTPYSVMVNSAAGGSNVLTFRTTGCPAPVVSSTAPSARPSGRVSEGASASSQGGLQGSGFDLGRDSVGGEINMRSTDESVPPAMPQYFTAVGTKGSSAVYLNWGASIGTSAVHYVLERSSDGMDWKLLSSEVTSTSFNDYSTQFAELYYYRVTAVDEHQMVSASSVVSINTDPFVANIDKSHGLTLASKDKVMQVSIPRDALGTPANCSFASDSELPLIGTKQRPVVGGPYKLVCQQNDGTIARRFLKPITVQVTLPETVRSSHKNVQFQAYSATDNSWKPVASTQKGSNVIELTSDSMALVAVAQPKTTPWWLTLLLVMFGAGVLAMALAIIAKSVLGVMQRRRLQAIEDDYWHKNSGI